MVLLPGHGECEKGPAFLFPYLNKPFQFRKIRKTETVKPAEISLIIDHGKLIMTLCHFSGCGIMSLKRFW